MKKILISLATIAAVAAIAFGASRAFFSDTETSVGNTFEAGAIDLKVDFKSSYNGKPGVSWELSDLTESEVFFNFLDVKPGDLGEGTISLHVYDNDAYACATVTPTLNDDMTSTEPELEAGDVSNTDSIFDGELAQNMQFRIWADMCDTDTLNPGDNVFTEECTGDRLLTTGTGPITPMTWA